MESYFENTRYLTQSDIIEILKAFNNEIKTHEERITDLVEYPIEQLTLNRIEHNEMELKSLKNTVKDLTRFIFNQQEMIEKLFEQNTAIQHMNKLLIECNICSKVDNDGFILENK
jgi:predicted RNase H-like nuclease (RuvC/YqgF family)